MSYGNSNFSQLAAFNASATNFPSDEQQINGISAGITFGQRHSDEELSSWVDSQKNRVTVNYLH